MKSAMTKPRPSTFTSNFSGSSYPLIKMPMMKSEARRCSVSAISLSLSGSRGVE